MQPFSPEEHRKRKRERERKDLSSMWFETHTRASRGNSSIIAAARGYESGHSRRDSLTPRAHRNISIHFCCLV